VIDGCPPRIPLSEDDIQRELDRRRPGQSAITTTRDEADHCRILSGVFEGQTLGTPISIIVMNKDARPDAYAEMKSTYRRPTPISPTKRSTAFAIGRAAAALPRGRPSAASPPVPSRAKILADLFPGFELLTYVNHVYDVSATIDPDGVTLEQVEANAVRCPDPVAAEKMVAAIEKARADGDSLGGTITCVARRTPAGLGEPVFDKLEADLAKAMLSLPASKGFEIGSGFAGTRMRGSEHNDAFEMRAGAVHTTTNHSGGVQGGISNGEDILFRVAFKPTSTIAREQRTVTAAGEETTLAARGRHDPCVLPRAVPM